MNQRAVVVFLGAELVDDAAWYVRFLKPGFIHCFVLIESRDKWIKIDGHAGRMQISYLGSMIDIVAHYRDQGATVVETTVRNDSIRPPVVISSCVGLVKSVLGERSFTVTPWQLYQYMQNCTRG